VARFDAESAEILQGIRSWNEHKPEFHSAIRGRPQFGVIDSSERRAWRQSASGLYELEIGRRIFEQEQQGADRAQHGKKLVRELATRMTGEFGSGFSISNLKYMRQFYLVYPERVSRIGQTASGQLGSPADSLHYRFPLSFAFLMQR
jgi:hypothetical protein